MFLFIFQSEETEGPKNIKTKDGPYHSQPLSKIKRLSILQTSQLSAEV